MDIYNFKLAPTNTNYILPFALTEKAFNTWLKSLENSLFTENTHQILWAIQRINKSSKLTQQKKSELLIAIYKAIDSFLNPLKATLLNNALPLTQIEQLNINSIVWLYAELANGFTSCLSNKSTLSSTLPLFYGLQSLIIAFTHIQGVHQNTYPNFWKQSYLFFSRANKLETQDLIIEQHNIHTNTVNKAFKQLLALYHADLGQFRAREIKNINDTLEKQTSLMLIERKINTKKIQQYSVFDVNSDLPPQHLKQFKKTETSIIYFFSAYQAAIAINKTAVNAAQGSGILKAINRENILQAAKTLSFSQKRSFTRLNSQKEKQGIIGLDNIIKFLRQKSSLQAPFTKVEKTPREINQFDPRSSGGGWKLPDIDLVTEGYEALDVMKNNLSDPTFINQKALSQQAKKLFTANQKKFGDSSIWSETDTEEDLSSIDIEKLLITDSSIKGYKIILHTPDIHSRVQTGDIIGIFSTNGLEIGTIRRILQLTNNNIQLGIKLLSLESELAFIALSEHKSIYTWTLFLPGIKALNTPDSLIFNNSQFQTGQYVELHRADTPSHTYHLNKTLNLSSAAVHVELFKSQAMDEKS